MLRWSLISSHLLLPVFINAIRISILLSTNQDQAKYQVHLVRRTLSRIVERQEFTNVLDNRIKVAIQDCNLDKEDMYAEFEDPTPNIRYDLAMKCYYTQEGITWCRCGICSELNYMENRDVRDFNPRDKRHYIRILGYDLRASHVINSSIIQSTFGVEDWRETYLGNAGRHAEAVVDIESFAAVTVHECNANFNPFVDKSGASRVPGPFGMKEIVSDSGATRHMFHDIKQFSSYREVKNHRVRVADGQTVDVLGIGDVGPLKEVLHVPSLVYDLVSESSLDKYGRKLCITDEGVKTFYNKTSDGKASSIFMVAKLSASDLYIVNPMYLGMKNNKYDYKAFCALASKAEAIDMLDKVLGHIHVERI